MNMAPTLERIDGTDSDAHELAAVLQRAGAVIVENAIDPDDLARMNAELDSVVASTEPGLRNPSHDRMVDFYGKSTIRLDGMPGRSAGFVELMLNPLLCGVADTLLLPNCDDYLFNTGQLIQIGPGETPQFLHRDEDAWGFYKAPKPLLEVEAMFALTDFTIDNGATQVVPGSHLWPAERQPQSDEIGRAEMSAGSALFYLGSTIHGGGENLTEDEWRRGLFLGYVVGWLRAEENSFLTVPIEKVKTRTTRVQELLGSKAHIGIGVVDVGSPMVMLAD